MKIKNKKIPLTTIIWLAALLSSCAVGKQYKQPDIAIPSSYYIKAQTTADTVLLPWRTFFKDPQLVSLIGQALERNNKWLIR